MEHLRDNEHGLPSRMGHALLAGILAIALIPTPAFADSDATADSRAAASESSAQASAKTTETETSDIVDGELIVTYKPGKSISGIVKDADIDADATEKLAGNMDGQSISLVKLDDSQDSDTAAAALEDDPRVESVEPNRTFHLLESVNDSYAGNSYYLQTEDIDTAWDYTKTEGAVSVAVMDSGVTMAASYRDPDLENTVDFAHAYDALNDEKLSSSYIDRLGHGTSVTSLIAAEANNDQGIAGTSYNANVVPVRVTDSNGEADTQTLIRGYQYVLEQAEQLNIKVINISLGGEASADDDALQSCINAAYDQGILTVAAAGNEADEGNPVEYPAALTHVISVGAVDENGTVADFSERNRYVDLTAAGVEICVPEFWRSEDDGYSGGFDDGWPWYFWSTKAGSKAFASSYDYVPDTYVFGDGTSFSAPIVSGIAALMYTRDSSATARDVEQALEAYATDRGATGRDTSYGYGEVNAASAVSAVNIVANLNREFRTSAPTVTSKKAGKAKITLKWASVSNADSNRIEYRVKGKKNWKRVSATGSAGKKTLSSLKRKTTYQVRVRASQKGWNDTGQMWSKYSKIVTVKTK